MSRTGLTMRNSKYIGRVGALAVALGVGFAVMVPPGTARAEEANCGMSSSSDRTALIMGGGTVPTPDQYLVEMIKNQYIVPTHPGEDIDASRCRRPWRLGRLRGSSVFGDSIRAAGRLGAWRRRMVAE